MRWEDGRRFMKDPRFPYVAFNMLMRHRALKSSKFALKQNPAVNKVTSMEDLRRKSLEELSKIVSRFTSSLHGSPSYWMTKSELLCLHEQLGAPALFFTLLGWVRGLGVSPPPRPPGGLLVPTHAL